MAAPQCLPRLAVARVDVIPSPASIIEQRSPDGKIVATSHMRDSLRQRGDENLRLVNGIRLNA
jgi:hypothetical protein